MLWYIVDVVDSREIPSRDEVCSIFEAVGLHANVPTIVNSVDVEDHTVVIDVTLRYVRETPVCCPEPACYIPAFGPKGLDKILTAIQERVTSELVLDLLVTAHLDFEVGYTFCSDIDSFEPKNHSIEYRYPRC